MNYIDRILNDIDNIPSMFVDGVVCKRSIATGNNSIAVSGNAVVSCSDDLRKIGNPIPLKGYPHSNIIKMDENNWVIQLALSGYDKTNILIEENNGRLIVSGKHPKKESETESKKYIHRGIAMRSFRQIFQLSEWMIVRDATMENGILSVRIELVVPEEKKPKVIKID